MNKIGHQLLSVNIFLLFLLYYKELWLDNTTISMYLDYTLLMSPLLLPVVSVFTLLPDIDTQKGTINRTLAPIGAILRFFVKHRGFTHRIEGIIAVWVLLFFLKNVTPIAFGIFMVLWIMTVFSNKVIQWLMLLLTLFAIYFSIQSDLFYVLALVTAFCAYVLHMVWDAITHEEWTLVELWKFRFRIGLGIFSISSWGFIEMGLHLVLSASLCFLLYNYILVIYSLMI